MDDRTDHDGHQREVLFSDVAAHDAGIVRPREEFRDDRSDLRAGVRGEGEAVGATGAELPEAPVPGEQSPATGEQQNVYLTRSAELNTQRWLTPAEAEDLLADERDAPEGR